MKIHFITPSCPNYRLPVFELFSKHHSAFFIFTMNCEHANFGMINHDLITSKFGFIRMLVRANCEAIISNFPSWGSVPTFLIMKIRQKKVIFWVEEWHEPLTLIRRLSAPFIIFMVKNCSAIVVSGKAAKAHMLSYNAVPSKIFTSPNSSWAITNDNIKLKSDDKFVILYLSRLIRYKGADYLIHAYSKLEKANDNVKLVIAGNGDFKADLKRLVNDLSLKNVEFIESVSEFDKPSYYQMCDVFVLPSIWQPDYCEAWGLVINEAMQFEKAIITTDAVGAASDLVKTGVNGFVVKNRDSEALYQALKKLYDNRSLSRKMGEASKKLVSENYTWEKMAKGFDDAIAYSQSPDSHS